MLDEQEAGQIVVDCIRAVSHVPNVDITGTLDDAEISNGNRVLNMVTLIVHSKQIGVPSRQHRIDSGWFLGTEPDTPILEVIGIVRDQSVPILDSALEDFAARVARHVVKQLPPSDKSNKEI